MQYCKDLLPIICKLGLDFVKRNSLNSLRFSLTKKNEQLFKTSILELLKVSRFQNEFMKSFWNLLNFNMTNWGIIFNKYLLFKSCGDCVALQDPYCAWDIKTNSCQAYRPGQKEQLQNVNIGYHPQCPVPIEPTTTVSVFAKLRSFENVMIILTVFP